MLTLRYLLITAGVGMMITAVSILAYDLYREILFRRGQEMPDATAIPAVLRWRTSLALALLAWAPLFIAFRIILVPSGTAGVRVSQFSGTVAGTLYPGAHLVIPFVEDVVLFDTRDQIFTTGMSEDGKTETSKGSIKAQAPGALPLNVQAMEGLTLGLAIPVRYRLDPKHLDYMEANLPRPVEKEIVPPTVASVWREIVPNQPERDGISYNT